MSIWDDLLDIGNEIPGLELLIPDSPSEEQKKADALSEQAIGAVQGLNYAPTETWYAGEPGKWLQDPRGIAGMDWLEEGRAPSFGEAARLQKAMDTPSLYEPGSRATRWMPEEIRSEMGLPGARAAEYQYRPESEIAQLGRMPTTGNMSPWEAEIGPMQSEAAGAYADPWGVMGQYESYGQTKDVYSDLEGVQGEYMDLYDQGGMDAIDMARWQEMKTRNDAAARGAREAALQQAEMRGMAGSGADLAAALSAAEGAAARNSAESLGIEAQAQQRRMDALAGAGNVAGMRAGVSGQQAGQASDIRGQSFGEAFNRGSAQDVINQFTVGLNADREARRAADVREAAQRDVDTRNVAQAGNTDWMRGWYGQDLAARNADNAYNTSERNDQGRYYAIEEPWRQYEADERRAAMLSGQYQGASAQQAGLASEKERARQGKLGALYGAAGQVGAAGLK